MAASKRAPPDRREVAGAREARDLDSTVERGSGGGALIRLKVVPGASRSGVAGTWDDRLRVRVAAAPEAGKANRALCALLAGLLAVAPASLEVAEGRSGPLKRVLVRGLSREEVLERLREALS
jgi:uncharacterized protein (TIGR00251 family)